MVALTDICVMGIVTSIVDLDNHPTRLRTSGEGANVIVFFPAVMDSGASFARLQFLLRRQVPESVAVVAVDPPGYGTDDGPLPSFREWPTWCTALASYFAQRYAGKCLFAGNSSGGVAATLAAVQAPRLAGLVLLCWCDWRLTPPPSADRLCAGSLEDLHRLRRSAWHNPPPISDAALAESLRGAQRYRRHVQSFDPETYRRTLSSYRGELAIVAGRADGLVTVEQARETVRHHAGASLFVIDECGHYPHREQPATLARLVASAARARFEDHYPVVVRPKEEGIHATRQSYGRSENVHRE